MSWAGKRSGSTCPPESSRFAWALTTQSRRPRSQHRTTVSTLRPGQLQADRAGRRAASDCPNPAPGVAGHPVLLMTSSNRGGRESCRLTPEIAGLNRERSAPHPSEREEVAAPSPAPASSSGLRLASPRTRGRGRWVGAGREGRGGPALTAAAPGGAPGARTPVRASVGGRGPHALCARRMSGPAEPGLQTRWRKAEAAVSDPMLRRRNPSSGLC